MSTEINKSYPDKSHEMPVTTSLNKINRSQSVERLNKAAEVITLSRDSTKPLSLQNAVITRALYFL